MMSRLSDQSDGFRWMIEATWVRYFSSWHFRLTSMSSREILLCIWSRSTALSWSEYVYRFRFTSLPPTHLSVFWFFVAPQISPSRPFAVSSWFPAVKNRGMQRAVTDCDADLSWLEMSKLIPTLFSHYEVELTNPNAELKETCWCAHHLAPGTSDH